jgi:Xaa-Pro aminopeptidase
MKGGTSKFHPLFFVSFARLMHHSFSGCKYLKWRITMGFETSQILAVPYQMRLQEVASRLGNHAMLVFAQPQSYRNGTVEGIYRQDSWFYYLTGFSETDAALLIRGHKSPSEGQVTLFLRDKDALAELWNGRRLGVALAKERPGIHEAFAFDQLWTKLPELLGGCQGLYYSLGVHPDNDRKVIESLRKARTIGARSNAGLLPVFDSHTISNEFRIIKRPEEIARMEAAAKITRQSFESVLKSLKPGMTERTVHGQLMGSFLQLGADMEAYGSIVAGGDNACCLHYRDNNAPLIDGDLLLIDAGCQFDNYASDVTRTYPIGGKFAPAQKSLYEITLRAQKAAFEECKPGSNWQNVQNKCFRELTLGLISIGFIQESVDDALAKNLHKVFCPHSISHWIGLDVHDAGLYSENGEPVPFRPGMYFSVEPGIYIPKDYDKVPPEYRGIGIRIEDDVLITETGYRILTEGIPKEVDEIEKILALPRQD